jgi:hypothetical protein
MHFVWRTELDIAVLKSKPPHRGVRERGAARSISPLRELQPKQKVSVPAPNGHLHDLGAAVSVERLEESPPCGDAQPMA